MTDPNPVGPSVTIQMTRNSVCAGDDVDAPNARAFSIAPGATLADVAATIAASNYLPMPDDAWGWTIRAGGATVAIRPHGTGRAVVTLGGDPAVVPAHAHPELMAWYGDPGARSRDAAALMSAPAGAPPARGWWLLAATALCLLLATLAVRLI